MKRIATLVFACVALSAAPALAQQIIGGHDETTEDHTTAQWAAAAASTPGTSAPVAGSHLLITEVGIRGLNSATLADSTEFIEITNPGAVPVDLSKYYLSDVNGYSALPVTGLIDLATTSTDFAFRFPTGALLGAGATIVIAVDGPRYKRGTGVDANYQLFDSAPGNTTATLMVDVGTNKPAGYPAFGAFTNGGEFLWLFFWDGASDLICDIDLVYWGAPTGANIPARKLATTCQDGPDGDAIASCYLVDAGNPAGTMGRALTVPVNGAGTRQRTGAEGIEATPGNGCTAGGPTDARHETWGRVKTRYR